MKKDNVYHVKIKLIPTIAGYKSNFSQGIVFAKNPSEAEKIALNKITEAIKNEPVKAELKIMSIKKLRKDFLLFDNTDSNENS